MTQVKITLTNRLHNSVYNFTLRANPEAFSQEVQQFAKIVADAIAMNRAVLFPDPNWAKTNDLPVTFYVFGGKFLSECVITMEYITDSIKPVNATPSLITPALHALFAANKEIDNNIEVFAERYPYAKNWEIGGMAQNGDAVADAEDAAYYGIYLYVPHTDKHLTYEGASWICDLPSISRCEEFIKELESITGKSPLPITYR